MSTVQQRSKKLQRIISETSFDDAKLQTAFIHQIYDSEGRKLSFLKVFSRQYGRVGHRVETTPSGSLRSSESPDATSSKTRTSTTDDRQTTSNAKVRRRVLVIFVRHFLCGLCQEYLRRLSTHPSLSRSNLLKRNLTVAIIGCGSPSYIPSYRALTNIPAEWGVYADPSAELHNILGMYRSLSMGDRRPVYIQRTMTGTMLRSVVQGLRRIPKGDVGKAGSLDVNGGEFLFEETESESDNWQLKWCHRMENSRDHTEIEDLVTVVGLSSAPNSPTAATTPNGHANVHNRSYSTPLILESTSIPNERFQSQAPIKRQFSLRRTISTRRQSWLARSNINANGSCSSSGGCHANARARELM